METTQPLVKGIGRDVAWSYVPSLGGSTASLLIAAVALRRAGTIDYGLFTVMLSFTTLLALLEFTLSTSIVRATSRHATANDTEDRVITRREIAVTQTALLVNSAVVMLASAGLAYFLPNVTSVPSERQNAALWCMLLVGVSSALGLASASLPAAAMGLRDFRTAALANLAGVLTRLVVVLALVADLKLIALGLAQLASIAVERLPLLIWVRRTLPWFPLRPSRPEPGSFGRLLSFALPLLALSVDSQIVAASDALVIGAVVGASGAAIYTVGARVPRQILQLLTQAATVAFPSFSASAREAEKVALMRFMTRVISYAGGVAFGLVTLFRRDMVLLLLGRESHAAEVVLALFSVTFAVDLSLNGIVLLLIARGRHFIMARLVPVELAMNIPMTVGFVALMGVRGAGVAALLSFLTNDLILFPIAARREFDAPVLRLIVADGLAPAALGAAVAAVSSWAFLALLDPSILRLAFGALVAAVIGLGAGLLALGESGRSSLRLASLRRTP